MNAKRICRLYIKDGLIVRTQKQAVRPNQKWSMDFVAQRLSDRRWIRVLTVVDQFTRECLTLFADNALGGEKVFAVRLGYPVQTGGRRGAVKWERD